MFKTFRKDIRKRYTRDANPKYRIIYENTPAILTRSNYCCENSTKQNECVENSLIWLNGKSHRYVNMKLLLDLILDVKNYIQTFENIIWSRLFSDC